MKYPFFGREKTFTIPKDIEPMEKVIINPEIEYFIVPLKHTMKEHKYITLWRPDNKGYSWPLELSGVYKGYQHGYHMSEGNIPVPVADIPANFIVKDREGRDCIVKNRASVAFVKKYAA